MPKKKTNTEKKKTKKFTSWGITREQKDSFLENLAMLLDSGMDIFTALDALQLEMGSRKLKKIVKTIREDIEAGSNLSQAVEQTGIFPPYVVSLIRIGEESGRLVENIEVVVFERKKEQLFRSKLRSAMLYPVFVLILSFILGVGVAWFVLPRLAKVFESLRIELPAITRGLIAFGNFLGEYGAIAIPATVVIFIFLIYIIFFLPATKIIGQFIMFRLPIIKKMLQEVEIARMGYIMGTLLEAGLPINEAIHSITDATFFYAYKRFYKFLGKSVEEGNSFKISFEKYKKVKKILPATLRQMIIAGESSGRLSETLIRIGKTFEDRNENTSKNVTVALEPILLVIVWLGVMALALAVILPVYNLVGQLG